MKMYRSIPIGQNQQQPLSHKLGEWILTAGLLTSDSVPPMFLIQGDYKIFLIDTGYNLSPFVTESTTFK